MTETPGLGPMVDALKQQVDEHGFIDVGALVERNLPVSSSEFDVTLAMLEEEGYLVHILRFGHVDDIDEKTIIRVLVGPGVTQEDIYLNREKIRLADFTQQ